MCSFATICFHRDKLKSMIHEKCPLRTSLIFRDIPSDTMLLAQISYNWNSTEYIPYFSGIPTNILLMLEIKVLKHEIDSLKGTILNPLQDKLQKIGFYSSDHNIKTIIDALE